MPFTPELRNFKRLLTYMSASTATNAIPFKFLLMESLISRLHPNAILFGNLIQIPGIPQETCKNIQRLVQREELDWARRLKVNIHLGHPLKQRYFGISGTISFKMPLKIHEQLTVFASIERNVEPRDFSLQTAFILRMQDIANISLLQPDLHV